MASSGEELRSTALRWQGPRTHRPLQFPQFLCQRLPLEGQPRCLHQLLQVRLRKPARRRKWRKPRQRREVRLALLSRELRSKSRRKLPTQPRFKLFPRRQQLLPQCQRRPQHHPQLQKQRRSYRLHRLQSPRLPQRLQKRPLQQLQHDKKAKTKAARRKRWLWKPPWRLSPSQHRRRQNLRSRQQSSRKRRLRSRSLPRNSRKRRTKKSRKRKSQRRRKRRLWKSPRAPQRASRQVQPLSQGLRRSQRQKPRSRQLLLQCQWMRFWRPASLR
mmetsp:Transcript_27493/g.49757  ORF Transcript_27493/g.49757 Transcript_27493/m.49757 type:complete len:272 (+) Transcript_27493:374-1189(+)